MYSNQNISTFNSRACINGNRRNLVVNYDKKEFYFSGCHTFNLGEVHNGLGIREVNNIHKNYNAEGYKKVSHEEVSNNWR